jgi:hypothetical protein
MQTSDHVETYLQENNYQWLLDPVALGRKYYNWAGPLLYDLNVSVMHEASNKRPDSNTTVYPTRAFHGQIVEPEVAIRGYYAQPVRRYNYLAVCASLYVHGFVKPGTEEFSFVNLSDLPFLNEEQIGSVLHWAELFLNTKLAGRIKRNEDALQTFRKKYEHTKTFAFDHEQFSLTKTTKMRLKSSARPIIPILLGGYGAASSTYQVTKNMHNINLIDQNIYDPIVWSDTYNAQVFLACSLNNFTHKLTSRNNDPTAHFDAEYAVSGGSLEYDKAYFLGAVQLGLFVNGHKNPEKLLKQTTLLHHQVRYDHYFDPNEELRQTEITIAEGIDWAMQFFRNTGLALLPRTLTPMYNKWLVNFKK